MCPPSQYAHARPPLSPIHTRTRIPPPQVVSPLYGTLKPSKTLPPPQMVSQLYGNDSRFLIIDHHVEGYRGRQAAAKFCLATAGWGWGGRMKSAVLAGCVPLIIQPGIQVEWGKWRGPAGSVPRWSA